MKPFYIFAILTILLNGCAKTSQNENLVDSANQTVDTLYEAIPKECRNETVKNLRENAKKQIVAIDDACTLQKDVLRARIRERNVIIFSLCLLILAYVGGKVFLRLRR